MSMELSDTESQREAVVCGDWSGPDLGWRGGVQGGEGGEGVVQCHAQKASTPFPPSAIAVTRVGMEDGWQVDHTTKLFTIEEEGGSQGSRWLKIPRGCMGLFVGCPERWHDVLVQIGTSPMCVRACVKGPSWSVLACTQTLAMHGTCGAPQLFPALPLRPHAGKFCERDRVDTVRRSGVVRRSFVAGHVIVHIRLLHGGGGPCTRQGMARRPPVHPPALISMHAHAHTPAHVHAPAHA